MATPALIEKLEDRLLLTTITVNSTDDTVIADADTTLREAIIAANATAGHDTIEFNIAGRGSAQTIDLASILPTVTDSVTIDGSTQGGWLTIDAAAVGTDTVLNLTTQAGGSTLQHFGISNAEGVAVRLNSVDDATIEDLDLSYVGGTAEGLGLFFNFSDNNTVRNVTATNRDRGIEVRQSSNNLIELNDFSQAGSNGIRLDGVRDVPHDCESWPNNDVGRWLLSPLESGRMTNSSNRPALHRKSLA
jgi:CSLREA domain-containing protein